MTPRFVSEEEALRIEREDDPVAEVREAYALGEFPAEELEGRVEGALRAGRNPVTNHGIPDTEFV